MGNKGNFKGGYMNPVKKKCCEKKKPCPPAITLDGIMEQMKKMEGRIMSAISDFAAKQNAFNDKMDTAITNLISDHDTQAKSIQDLKDQLAAAGGAVSADDIALLDAILARSQVISDKLDALDALTPPATPVA